MWVETRTTKDGQIRYRFLERYTCPYSGGEGGLTPTNIR